MKKILIIGAGAIGSTLAYFLQKAECEVTLLTRNPITAQQISKDGIRIQTDQNSIEAVHVTATASVSDLQTDYDAVMIATRAYDLQEAVRSVMHIVGQNTLFFAMTNGNCLQMLAEEVGDTRAVGCSIGYGAERLSDNEFRIKIPGNLIVGMQGGYLPPSLSSLVACINKGIPCSITDNIEGTLYAKLLINACITSVQVLTGQKLGEVLENERGKELFLGILREGVQVANAAGITVAPYANKINFYSVTKSGIFATVKRKLLISYLAKKYKDRTSASLEALKKGHRTEIEFLNGYIVKLGLKYGVPTPINQKLCFNIAEIENDPSLITPYNLNIVLGQ